MDFNNCNFSENAIKNINSFEPLKDWFIRNKDLLVYFELTHYGCTHFESNSMANNDIVILGRMANAAFYYIDQEDLISFLGESRENIVLEAAIAMEQVYKKHESMLSDKAKKLYFVDMEKMPTADFSTSKSV